MTAIRFHVHDVFDLPSRGGLIAVGSTRNGDVCRLTVAYCWLPTGGR
jgi:hypothetical protein